MALDPADKAELLDLLRDAIKGRRAADADAERIWPAAGADDAHIWLTATEAAAFMRIGKSAFYDFKREHAGDLVISHPLGGSNDPRYQLASLRRYMLENAVGLPDPLPGMADLASTKINGKRRGVSLRR